MATKLLFRRGTSSQWASVNPVLSQGEPGLEIDTLKVKMGDGTTAWASLPYGLTSTTVNIATSSVLGAIKSSSSVLVDSSGVATVTPTSIGLGNVTNVSQTTMLNNSALTGIPTVPTASLHTNTAQAASTAYVEAEVAALVSSAPSTLVTLKELADALGDDANYAATTAVSIGLKAPISSPTFTGTPNVPTPSPFSSSNQISDTRYVDLVTGNITGLTTTSKTNLVSSINEVVTDINTINATNQTQTQTLNHGQNLVTTGQDTPFNVLAFNGRTLVNILGRDGNCEDVSKWSGWQSTLTNDATSGNFVCGSTSIKITITSTTGNMYRNMSAIPAFSTSNYYLISAYVKNGNATNVSLLKGNGGGGVTKQSSIITSTSGFSFVYMLCQPSDLGSTNEFDVQVNGASGNYVWVDGISIDPISSTQYTTLLGMTSAQVADMYPYVDSVQFLQNPEITAYGKNLLPPFSQWSLTTNAKLVSPYSISYTPTSLYDTQSYIMPVLPSTQYTYSASGSSTAYFKLAIFDKYGNTLSIPINNLISANSPATFTTQSNASYIVVYLFNSDTNPVVYTNPMLNLGSTALPFEVADPSYLYLTTQLADGETCQYINGAWQKTKLWMKNVVLDGSGVWGFSTNKTGFKWVFVPMSAYPLMQNYPSNAYVIKYNGNVFNPKSNGVANDTTGDNADYDSGANNFYIAVNSADSGWGDSYTPSVAEIQAYFYGWIMGNVDGSLYTSGTKTWWKMYVGTGTAGGTLLSGHMFINGSGTTTLPVVMNDQGYTPYTLSYQLATPITEIVQSEGSLEMHDGLNQVELGEGIVAREAVVPSKDSGNNYYAINIKGSGSYTDNPLKYRPLKFISVYKNGLPDSNWIPDVFGGMYYLYIKIALYDPTASYSVTYQALDAYKFTTNNVSGVNSITYSTNDHTVLQNLERNYADTVSRVSVLEETKVSIVTGGTAIWITPTLLNGWTNYGGSISPAGYMKDSLGFVHCKGAIKNGNASTNTAFFTLPAGYRPLAIEGFPAYTNDGSLVGTCQVGPSGSVLFISGGNTSFFLTSIIFRAEQ